MKSEEHCGIGKRKQLKEGEKIYGRNCKKEMRDEIKEIWENVNEEKKERDEEAWNGIMAILGRLKEDDEPG